MINNILAVSVGGLGDTILFSPVLKALRAKYVSAEIHLLAASCLTKEAYGQCQEIDNITVLHVMGRKKFWQALEFFRFALSYRKNIGCSIGVFATGLNSKLIRMLKLVSGIKNVYIAPSPPHYPTDFLCNLSLASIFCKDISEKDVFFPSSPEAFREAKAALLSYGISIEFDRYLVIYPSTDLPHRPRFMLEKLADSCQEIKERGFKGKIIVVGSASEGREWDRADTHNAADANLAGKISVSAVGDILRNASLAIGNDGGIMHVAGAVGCPVVAIMPNTPVSYRPAGRKTKIVKSNYQCCLDVYPNRPNSCTKAKCAEDIKVRDIVKLSLELLPII